MIALDNRVIHPPAIERSGLEVAVGEPSDEGRLDCDLAIRSPSHRLAEHPADHRKLVRSERRVGCYPETQVRITPAWADVRPPPDGLDAVRKSFHGEFNASRIPTRNQYLHHGCVLFVRALLKHKIRSVDRDRKIKGGNNRELTVFAVREPLRAPNARHGELRRSKR